MRVVILLIITLWPGLSWSSLLVYPTRIVLSEDSKVATLSFRHTGSKVATYIVTTAFYRMQPDGGMTKVKKTTEADRNAKEMFRYWPKKFTIQPNLRQVVRIRLDGMKKYDDGEYRTHLYFRPVDEDTPTDANNDSSFNLILKAQVAIAIPVIVKKGKFKAKPSLSNFEVRRDIETNEYLGRVEITNTSKAFLYGDIQVFHKNAGEKKLISIVKGVSSYIEKRALSFKLNQISNTTNIANGDLIIEFSESLNSGGKLLAQTSITSPFH